MSVIDLGVRLLWDRFEDLETDADGETSEPDDLR
jgi:hypothetical protein